MASCAPIANRRCFDAAKRVTNPPQAASLHHRLAVHLLVT
jgi:hypothetical protein